MTSRNAHELIDDEYIALEETMTVDEAIDQVRSHTPDRETTVYTTYVLGTDDRLAGTVSLRELLNHAGDKQVSEITTTDVVTIHPTDQLRYVGKLFAKHGFAALPVVDDDDKFLGIIRAQRVVDALGEQTSKELLRDTQSYFTMGD